MLEELKNEELSSSLGFEVPQETVTQSMVLQRFKILGTIDTECFKALVIADLEEVEFAVDIGATEAVIGEDALKAGKK